MTRALLSVPLIALALAGCAAADVTAPSSASSSPSPSPSTPAPATTPVEALNCGTPVPVGQSPERIVTVKSTPTELLIELGLGEAIVGAAFLDGPLAPPYTDAPEVPVLSEFTPGQEATLALEPDAIYAGWESVFSPDGVGERASLEDRDILTYVDPSACKGEGRPERMTFDLLWEHILTTGAVFSADDAASTLVSRLQEDLAGLSPSTDGITAAWYSSGKDAPYVGAGTGAPQMIMDAAGLTNIFANVEDTWTSATWEAVVEADPDVIVLVDAAWNTAEGKIEFLETNPATAALTAVREGRYLTVPFAAGEAGVRNVEAVASLIDQLEELGTR